MTERFGGSAIGSASILCIRTAVTEEKSSSLTNSLWNIIFNYFIALKVQKTAVSV